MCLNCDYWTYFLIAIVEILIKFTLCYNYMETLKYQGAKTTFFLNIMRLNHYYSNGKYKHLSNIYINYVDWSNQCPQI